MAKVFDFKYLYDISNVYTYLFYKLSDTGLEVIKLEIERLRHLVRVSEELEF